MTAIAVVGMACRFAGAPDLQAYWRLLRDGRHAFGPVPPDRWSQEAFTGSSARDPDRSTSPVGGFIEDVRTFPALALGIPPRRVEVMDPQQRFALESAIEAIEDAGYAVGAMPKETGVYVGITAHEYRTLQTARVAAIMMASGQFGDAPEDLDALAAAVGHVVPTRPFTAPGVLGNMAAAIVAQELDLVGPAYTLDAACASAMVAVANAVSQLRAGQVDVALAGGAYLQLTPEHYVAFSRIGAMSKQGQCLPFDERADGFVQGDGVGMMVLKRLEDAQRDGDRIYACLEGIAINNDGRGDGPMAPLASGQTSVIRAAWADAGRDPSVMQHLETHGTGTSVGDVTELHGLGETLSSDARVVLSSSKAHVGHTMSAAGIAGLISAVLALHHKVHPPIAGFDTPKAELAADPRLQVLTQATPWSAEQRWAAVSSFGFGGTNGHVVLRNVPPAAAVQRQHELVLMSAPTEQALRDLCGRTALALRDDPEASPAGLARAWARRRPQRWRVGLVVSSRVDLLAALDAVAAGEPPPIGALGESGETTPRVGFLFPGQGAQRVGMLHGVAARFPAVRDTLEALEDALHEDLGVPLTQLVWPDESLSAARAAARLTATEHCQPVMLAAGLSLARLLSDLGVHPAAVAGHSLGEFAAASVGGVLSAADAARFVARRGRAMADLEGDPGSMAALRASEDQVRAFLVDGAVIANVNHPSQVVVSGTTAAVASTCEAAAASQVEATLLDVSHAFHSPVLSGLHAGDWLSDVHLSDPTVPVVSAISGQPYRDANDAREVFERHATSPVLFTSALQSMIAQGVDVILQVGAGGPLASFARGTVGSEVRAVLTLAGRDDADSGGSLLVTLAALWSLGVDLDVSSITAPASLASVPPSVLARESYWAIRDVPAKALDLGTGTTPRPRAPAVEVAPAPASPETPVAPATADDVLEGVLEVVAKVSAYPRASLRPGSRLLEDLGFDSLMMGDLATGLSERFPGLPGIPQELLVNQPTVAVLADFVKTGGSAVPVDDDAPLRAFATSWSPCPLPTLPGRWPDVGTWVITGGDAEEARRIGQKVAAAGHDLRIVPPPEAGVANAKVLVWVAPQREPVSTAAVMSGQAPCPDPAADLLAVLAGQARKGRHPDLVILSRHDDPWSAALAGVARSVAREWPDAMVRHLSTDRPLEAVPWIEAELASAERTVDVRYEGGVRHLRTLAPMAASRMSAPGPDDVVAVTGGTRGIGLQVGLRLASLGAKVLLLGRSAPDPDTGVGAFETVEVVLADVTDREALHAALAARGVTALVHAAGVLADGPLESLDPEAAHRAHAVKVEGWLNALSACGGSLRRATVIGSWAGAFGNRHQAPYAAANALAAALTQHPPAGVTTTSGAFGPWTDSAMAKTIPAPVMAQMRADGVDFVGLQAGVDAVVDDLCGAPGPRIRARDLPVHPRRLVVELPLSTDTDPYLLDHAIDGTPVLPLASVADLIGWAAGLPEPYEVRDLTLYAGVTVTEPVTVTVEIDGARASVRSADGRIHDRATVRPIAEAPAVPAAPTGGDIPSLSLARFYDDVTFHGPLLQGILSIDAVGPDFVRGTVVAGTPSTWTPGTHRARFAIDPLALDSAMQLAAYVAWIRYRRAGTPVSVGRISVLKALEPEAAYDASVHFGEAEADRFSATIVLRQGEDVVLVVEDVVAELRAQEGAEPPAPAVTAPETSDPSQWAEVRELDLRLEGVAAMGLQNPYFHVHEGTARDTTTVDGRSLVNFSSYNYLGLSGDPRVAQAVYDAVDRYGTSVSASRVASGERPFHGELERALAKAQRAEDALLFTAGHATNVTTIGHLMGPEDLVLHDAYIHDSALQGIKLSGASRRAFRHEDIGHLEQQLTTLRPNFRRCLVIVEGVYSMDGDLCNLPRYIALKRAHGALLMVDEAHSFGVVGDTGRGVAEHYDVAPGDVDLWMGTLSKSLASCGGWIAGSAPLIRYLRYTAPGFVYSAGLTPANGVAALAALQLMFDEPQRVRRLQRNASRFHAAAASRGLDTGPARGGSAVVPIITGNSMHALVLSERLQVAGINVQPIVYPAVPDDAARLRFFLSSTHTPDQLERTAHTVADLLEQIRQELPLP